jgi:DNA replication and repair protein RecF
LNFKNLKDVQVSFSSRLNCLIGNNGAGKTNLMDAVYYLSFCKSFFNASDQLNIMHNEEFFLIKGIYSRLESKEAVSCALQKGQKKLFKRNSKIYNRLADHIGLLPLVMITPSDVNLILEGSAERRKFMDGVISQYDPDYLHDLLQYNRALFQRNNLLRQFASNNFFDQELLSVYDSRLIEHGNRIHVKRSKFVKDLIPVFQKYYSYISMGNERVDLIHQSDLYNSDFELLLNDNILKDKTLQYTTTGVHKDDLLFNIDQYSIKRLGSQGQKKTYLVALKMAQFNFIAEISGMKPILLLDDIFDKLDRNRVEQIIKLVSGDQFGQIFITDTNRGHLDGILKEMSSDFRIFQVTSGSIKEIQ